MFMNSGPSKHLSLFTKNSYRIMSRRLLTKMHDTVESMGSALNSAQRPGSEVYGENAGASALRKRKCVEGGWGTLESDERGLFLERV